MFSLLNSFMAWYVARRLEEIQNFIRHPHETQFRVLMGLVSDAQYTEFGKKHDFSKIKLITDFKKSVPLVDYDGIKSWIERGMQGEQNLLWGSEVTWYAKSSGTTSDKSKFIPVSNESLNEIHFKGSHDCLSLYYSCHPQAKLFRGKSLVMTGSHAPYIDNSPIKVGDVSAVMMQNMPFFANYFRAPEKNILLMDEWEAKIEKLAESSVKENITHIAGVPTWTLVLIKKILESTGKQNIHEVWKDLELYTHGGVSFTPYKKQFLSLCDPSKINFLQTYNASEGFFAIQDKASAEDMLLMLDYGIFYEFMPLEELDKEEPKTLTLAEVELDTHYALVISTNSGLWRYKVGDTVKFTSLDPYRVIVSGRTKAYINTFGEELMVDNADRALSETCRIFTTSIRDYTAAPVFFSDNENGTHEWIIELEEEVEDQEKFIVHFDLELKKCNSDYEAKRYKDIALRMPIVHFVPKGTFISWMKSKNKVGGQNKVPRLCNERKYVEEILLSLRK